LRILRPSRLPPAPPPFDPAQVLELIARENAARGIASPQATPEPSPEPAHEAPPRRVRADAARKPPARRQRDATLQANPFIVAAAAALVGVAFLVALEPRATDTLYIQRIDAAEAPRIDGETSDPIWRKVPAVAVLTEQGGNFYRGETRITVQAVHDGTFAYFLFVWDDPTRSLKQLPLRKTAKGWQLLHDGFETGDERAYHEDKFAVLFTRLDAVLAGDLTFHAGPEPVAGKPRTLSQRGLHYTADSYVDVWQWKAVSTNASSYCDDDHFGPPAEATKAQYDGAAPYRGGFSPDPGQANYQDNFAQLWASAYAHGVTPKRLPKDLVAMTAALGPVDLDPEHGEIEGARWFITEEESVPYSTALDRLIPEGTIIPGVIIAGQYGGDRADVRCAGRWAAGRWALEAVRRLDTGSQYDVPIATGTYMRVAAFDHSQIRHTRHVRPLRLEMQP
jgi:ethylbenzene dehydrogenase